MVLHDDLIRAIKQDTLQLRFKFEFIFLQKQLYVKIICRFSIICRTISYADRNCKSR